MNNLISLSEYVELQLNIKQSTSEFKEAVRDYTKFLRQPLTLGMFVPCDEKGNVLSEPKLVSELRYEIEDFQNKLIAYEEAKERVLFVDTIAIDRSPYQSTKRLIINLAVDPVFRIYTELRFWDGTIEKQEFPNNKDMTIEDLVKYGLPLTPSALKMIGKE